MPKPSLLVIDAHVHIHDCFDRSRFFGSAFSNCEQVAWNVGHTRSHIPVLLLAEGRRQHAFKRIQEETKNGNNGIADRETGSFQVIATEEVESLRIQKMDGTCLFLISGRQIVTAERLEVLALSTVSEIQDGLALEETIAAVEKEGALPVIPWGFGKWLGKRRRALVEYLASRRDGVFYLGDNGGRPNFLRVPDFQREAPGLSLKLLPGSDPLPLPSELQKVGRFGFTLQEDLDTRRPGEALKRILMKDGVVPTPFGSPESTFRFAWNQMSLQVWKRRI